MDIDDLDDTLHSMSVYFADHQELVGSFHCSFGRSEDGDESLAAFPSSIRCVIGVVVFYDSRLYCELVVVLRYEGGVVTE